MSFKEFTDITKLHTLDVGYLDGARDIVSLLAQWQSEDLPELKHLSFALNDSAGVGVYDLISDFLKTCSPLESLSIKDGANYIPLSAVLSHKATLRTLVLHEVESASSDDGRSMSIEEVKWLSESCEVLEDITIDAGKISTGDGLNEILSTLATFPLLCTIRLYIPLGVADEDLVHGIHSSMKMNKSRNRSTPYEAFQPYRRQRLVRKRMVFITTRKEQDGQSTTEGPARQGWGMGAGDDRGLSCWLGHLGSFKSSIFHGDPT